MRTVTIEARWEQRSDSRYLLSLTGKPFETLESAMAEVERRLKEDK